MKITFRPLRAVSSKAKSGSPERRMLQAIQSLSLTIADSCSLPKGQAFVFCGASYSVYCGHDQAIPSGHTHFIDAMYVVGEGFGAVCTLRQIPPSYLELQVLTLEHISMGPPTPPDLKAVLEPNQPWYMRG